MSFHQMMSSDGQYDVPRGDKADSSRWIERGFLLAIVLSCAAAMSPNVAGPDLWGHVQYGRDLLATGRIPWTTTYSYTAEGYPWINHENLAEVLLALGADTIGPTGLVLVKFLLSLLVVLLLIRSAYRQGAQLVTVCIVALMVAVNMGFHWSIRPQLLTYVFFTLMLVLLEWCFDGWQGRWHMPWGVAGPARQQMRTIHYSWRRLRGLWLAVPLFFLWANSHGGFVAGLCIYSVYLGCRMLEVLLCRRRAGWGVAVHLALMIAAAGLATLVNPYGPRLHLWLIRSLGTPRPEITEWHAPQLMQWDSIEIWLLLVLFVTSLLLTRRQRDFTQLVLITVTLWQSLEHLRHLPFFALLFGFWMPVHVQSLLQRFGVGRFDARLAGQLSRPMRRLVIGGLMIAFGLLAARLAERLSDLRVERSRWPVSAMQFIADHQLRGRMVVTYNWAQYAIAAFGSREGQLEGIRVSFDGRFRTCYPQQVVDMNFDFVLGPGGPERRYRGADSPPFDSARVLEFGRPDLVLISRRQTHSVRVMLRHQDRWVLLYQDELAQLWGRRDRYDDPASADYLPPRERIIGDAPQEGYVSWPALPVRSRPSVQPAHK